MSKSISTAAGAFSPRDAERISREQFAFPGSASPLASYSDLNFLIEAPDGSRRVLKIAGAAVSQAELDLQNQAMLFLAQQALPLQFPLPCPTAGGEYIVDIHDNRGNQHLARLLTYLPGRFVADQSPLPAGLPEQLGLALGKTDRALLQFDHPAARRELPWNPANVINMGRHLNLIKDCAVRRWLDYFLLQWETHVQPVIPELRHSIIHNDANDHNILLTDGGGRGKPRQGGRDKPRLSGLIDFGDMLHTFTVAEAAVAAAYLMMKRPDPLEAAAELLAGYHRALALSDLELEIFFFLVAGRLCLSLGMSAEQKSHQPENTYITVSEEGAAELLLHLGRTNPLQALDLFRRACGMREPFFFNSVSREEVLKTRRRHFPPALSLSYRQPLRMTGGALQYLYDESGRTYLDCVNNVCHVGHCHPQVVRAGQRQMALLNTNSRYLHDLRGRYLSRLAALFPAPLEVCFLVNSGSEANDLALRIARTVTGRQDVIVLEGAYHGNTYSVIELSPYKFDGPGGAGRSRHVHVAPLPDTYRGEFRREDPHAGKKYAARVAELIDRLENEGCPPAAFFAESLPGCAGQIELPPGYLQAAYAAVRRAGGLCIADEVQVGFGRVGSHMWGFETQEVVPDIVTLGKPIGNGHPLAAVITTREIARAFHNGMEYFNTFGGNPVSCAIGLAVLEVLEKEQLPAHAQAVGEELLSGLQGLMARYPLIGDVRGRGLFLGIEWVSEPETRQPAAALAGEVVEKMKERGILLSTDGPFHNVIKIKPPLPFSRADAQFLLSNMEAVLAEIGGRG